MKKVKFVCIFLILWVGISCKTVDVHVLIPKDYLQLNKTSKLKFSAALYEINTINYSAFTNTGNGIYRVRFKLIYGD